jgi:hypothetical protein
MKRIFAVLCAAALVTAACVTTFAGEVEPATETTTVENNSPINPIIPPIWPPFPGGGGNTDNQGGQGNQGSDQDSQSSTSQSSTSQSTSTTTTTPTDSNGYRFEDYKESNFTNIPEANKDLVKKVLDLFKDGQAHTFAEILGIFLGDSAPATLTAKPSGKQVKADDLEVISKLLDVVDSKGNPAPHAKITLSTPGNELTKGVADGKLFVFSVDTSKATPSVALYDASADANNVITTTLDDAFGCHLLVKEN